MPALTPSPVLTSASVALPRCGNCVHFANAPAAMEAALPGLATMGSGFGSVRAQDGLCALHGYYLAAWDRCARFDSKQEGAPR